MTTVWRGCERHCLSRPGWLRARSGANQELSPQAPRLSGDVPRPVREKFWASERSNFSRAPSTYADTRVDRDAGLQSSLGCAKPTGLTPTTPWRASSFPQGSRADAVKRSAVNGVHQGLLVGCTVGLTRQPLTSSLTSDSRGGRTLTIRPTLTVLGDRCGWQPMNSESTGTAPLG